MNEKKKPKENIPKNTSISVIFGLTWPLIYNFINNIKPELLTRS